MGYNRVNIFKKGNYDKELKVLSILCLYIQFMNDPLVKTSAIPQIESTTTFSHFHSIDFHPFLWFYCQYICYCLLLASLQPQEPILLFLVLHFLTHTHSFVFYIISYHVFVFTVIKYVLYYMPLLSIDQYQKLPIGCIICLSTTFRAFTRNSEGFDLNMKSNISLFLAILKPFPFWHSKMS